MERKDINNNDKLKTKCGQEERCYYVYRYIGEYDYVPSGNTIANKSIMHAVREIAISAIGTTMATTKPQL